MRNILNVIKKNRNTNKKIIIMFICLSILVEVVIIKFLIQPAYSLVNKADCGITEHIHISECYSEHKQSGESVLVCIIGLSTENLSHVHDNFCYDENGKIICSLPEYQHIHTDECYDENGVQTCGVIYHQHKEECFRVLGENDSALVLECGKVSHVHDKSCYLMISSVSPDEVQEDFEETDKPEAEMYEFEAEIYEPEIAYDIAEQNIDVDAAQGFELEQRHIKSITLQYKDGNGKWNVVTPDMKDVPANSNMRIDVDYKDIDKNDIKSHNNQLVYKGIPAWINPDSTADIRDQNGDIVASLAVGNGNAVITFMQTYLDSLVSNVKISGTFSVEGSADWRQITNPSNPDKLPFLDLNFQFEDALSAKYGEFNVEKSSDRELVEVRENGKIIHTYLKYNIKVKSLESNKEIPEICITDTLSTENRLNINDVIKNSGYFGVDSSEKTLAGSENNYNPYETVTGVESYSSGTVVLDSGSMKWSISSLKPNEERTLVYYVELNEKYVGSGSAGTLCNEAQPESKGFTKGIVRDEFIPKADADISKTQGTIDVNSFGNGNINYTVVVTASDDNSYTITDASIKDSFRDGMADYVDTTNGISVTVKSGNTQQTQNISVEAYGFTIPIPELKHGESVEVTYSVPVKNIFASNNGDVSFSNHASFVGDEASGKLQSGYTFKGSGITTTISHNQWTRKLNGLRVDTEKYIDFSGNAVYNYGESTPQNDKDGFKVPENAQEYIVIVNEDGMWNMSNTSFKDTFGDTRIAYRGYLKIEEFNRVEDIGENNSLSNSEVLSILDNQTLAQTVWINIDGRHDFDVVPTRYGLTNGNKVYRLTYYASVDSNQTNIKNIVVANSFTIEGTIGIDGGYIVLNGVRTVVSSTLTGSASYDFEKEPLFYEKKYYTSGNGEIYWVIRANGTLQKNLHIQDSPSNNSMRSDSLVGVYFGDKNYDFSNITSYEKLETALSNDMELIEGGTSQYFYNLESINSLADLDGKDYAIFSRGENRSGYLTGIKNGDNKMKGESLDTRVTFGNDVITTSEAQVWHFERVENDKFYIYYTDSSGTHYMHISSRAATISNEQGDPLTVSIDNNNQIKIVNPDEKSNYSGGEALNWYGNNGSDISYSGWNNTNDGNNWHYLGALDNTPKYDYKPQKITDVNDLDGNQFAIITPGKRFSGLLTGNRSGSNALTGQQYEPHFTDNPPDDIIISTQLKKWTFQKINETNDEFYVYYDEGNQRQYLTLGDKIATTTTTPYTIQVSCTNDGRIKLKDTAHAGHTLNWYGGNQNDLRYSSWSEENQDNDLHYVAAEEIISQDSSGYTYNWSFSNSHGSIKIINTTFIPQDKSMYIIMRTQPNQELSGRNSKTFNNEIGIMDDASGNFDVLDHASYIYKPNLPVFKEGMVAAYYDGKDWTNHSFSPSGHRATKDENDEYKLNALFDTYFNPNSVAANGAGLYVEWLINVNWDGTLEGDVVLTDNLNHKMEPVSVKKFNGVNPDYFDLPELEKNPDWTKSQTNDVPFYYNSKTGELKIGIGNLHKSETTNDTVVNLQLICRVTDPDVLFSGDISTLTNTAEVSSSDGTFIGSHKQNHKIYPAYSINKIGSGVGDNGNHQHSTNKMEYTIEINPFEENLVSDSDILPVLIDEMSSNMEIMGTVDVYKKINDTKIPLNNISYSVIDIDDKTQIKFDNLPDKTHLIIKYKTTVNVKPSQTASVSNIAYWEGHSRPSKPQSTDWFEYNLSGSVTSREEPVIVINKVDFYDNGITLGGAKFEIRRVNTDGTINNSDVITVTTGNDGEILFAESEGNPLHCNIVYQLKEVKAPTDYVLDNTPKYFMVINPRNQHNYTIDGDYKMYIDGKQTDILISYISNDAPDLEVTVYNKKACVKIDKVFRDESGESADFYGTYSFGLYYRNPINSNEKPVQILSITYSDDGISYVLDDKETFAPEFTKAIAGNMNFIYELNEKNEPINNGKSAYLNGYSFDVEYSSNSVFVTATGATITVTNKYHPIYMPMTGGIGLNKYYRTAFCVLMTLSAFAVITLKVRKKYK